MALEDYVVPPRINEKTKEIQECTDRAVDRVINMSPEQKEEYVRMVETNIARVNQHSYEVNLGQARRLSKLDRMYITRGFIY